MRVKVNTEHPKWKDALRVLLHCVSHGRLVMVPGHDPDMVCTLHLEVPRYRDPRYRTGG